MSHRSFWALVAALLAFAVSACGGQPESQPAAATSAAPEAEAAYPVTVEGANGELTLERQPQRIVSLSPTATEGLFAVGAGEQVVGVDDQSNFPAEAPRTKLSGFQPNIEAVAGFEPDLVVAGFDPGGLISGLEKLDVPVLLLPAAPDLEEAYRQIETLGAATGHAEEASRLVTEMRSEIAALADLLPEEAAGRSVYHEISPDFFSATSKTFIGSVYELLGLRNIADEAGGGAPDFPQLSAEYILSANPDLIVLADTKCCGQTPAKVADRAGWETLAAVREGMVIPVDDDVASRWGPRTVAFVETVVEALSGDRAG